MAVQQVSPLSFLLLIPAACLHFQGNPTSVSLPRVCLLPLTGVYQKHLQDKNEYLGLSLQVCKGDFSQIFRLQVIFSFGKLFLFS